MAEGGVVIGRWEWVSALEGECSWRFSWIAVFTTIKVAIMCGKRVITAVQSVYLYSAKSQEDRSTPIPPRSALKASNSLRRFAPLGVFSTIR